MSREKQRKMLQDDFSKTMEVEGNMDGTIKLPNPYINQMSEDFLYHLGLGSHTHNLVEMFGDVRFVCMGGAPKRMEQFAKYILKEIKHELPTGTDLINISAIADRYAMYKVGPVISISHGMGMPSLSICIHEVIKLLYYAKCKDPVLFRLGTSGGIGVEPGTVVITNAAVDPLLRGVYEQKVCGKLVERPAVLNQELANELKNLVTPEDGFKTVTGKTAATDDFYEGQGRLDGAICEYKEEDKMEYIRKLNDAGVVNFEMEATAFAALTHYIGIKSAILCVTFLDRLKGDQVTTPKETLLQWQQRPFTLVGRYIKKHL